MITLRKVTEDDLEIILAWRSNPLVYRWFYIQSRPLEWEEHRLWWEKRRYQMDWIIVFGNRDVGSVNVSSLDTDTPFVSVFIGDVNLWGSHIGRKAVALAVRWLKGYKKVRANIMEGNIASIKLFESLGFKQVSKGRKGELVYELELKENRNS